MISFRGPSLSILAFGIAALGPCPAQITDAVVNAPVAPEAIYVGVGSPGGISVIDMNGFGQGTGDINNTRFPLNPNVGRPGVTPSLAPGTTNRTAGSGGAMSLTRDSLGSTRLIGSGRFGAARLGSVVDLHLGQPLDLVYNNSNINLFASSALQINPATGAIQPGNTIMVAPHPNPPRLVWPSPNPARRIDCEEPTVTSSLAPPGTIVTSVPCLLSPPNLLTIGNPFSTSPSTIGLFDANFAGAFYGPQPPPPVPPPPTPYCPFTCRQQIGHFLYALDADSRRVVVLNSNRFTVLASIRLPDPTSMAMAPNLRLLAVSNATRGTVSFIDVNPTSATFHQVVASTRVGRGPRGLAWQPEGEDLLVCNRNDNSMSIISGATLQVRRTVRFGIQRPLDVAVTARQTAVGTLSGTYFAFVLNANGTVAVYESGPTAIGLDDTTFVTAPFAEARAIQPDLTSFQSACWVTHQDDFGLAQVSRLELTRSSFGPMGVVADASRARGRMWTVTHRYGGANPTIGLPNLFSGKVAIDLAFDDIRNFGAFPDVQSSVVGGLSYAAHSGKGQLKASPSGMVPTHFPKFMIVALADTGKVDLIQLATSQKIRSLDVAGVRSLGHYWRQ